MDAGFPIKQDSLSLNQQALNDYKKRFAEALLRNPAFSPFQAALTLFPADPGAALKASDMWATDPAVIMYKEELLAEKGEKEFLPTKEEFLGKIWSKLDREHIDAADFVKLSDIYAKVRGFYPDPKAQQTNLNIVGDCAKVMVVTSHASDEEWEAKVAKQQFELRQKDSLNILPSNLNED